MCHFTCSYWQAWQSVCFFEFLTLMRNKGMQLHLFLVLSVFSSWSPPPLLSNSYPLQFTWRVCGPVPLYLHVRGGCVSSWTVCLNLKQPRDTLLSWRWQLYCLRRHNAPPLNVTPLGLPKTQFPHHFVSTMLVTDLRVCTDQRFNWFLPACVQSFGYLSAFIICCCLGTFSDWDRLQKSAW